MIEQFSGPPIPEVRRHRVRVSYHCPIECAVLLCMPIAGIAPKRRTMLETDALLLSKTIYQPPTWLQRALHG